MLFKCSHFELFYKKNAWKCTGKCLLWSLLLIKLQTAGSSCMCAILLRDFSDAEFFLFFFWQFSEQLLCRTHGCSLDTRRKLNVHKTFRRRLLNVFCTFNLLSVSRGVCESKYIKTPRRKANKCITATNSKFYSTQII